MRFNRKLFAALLTVCMVLNAILPVSAATLQATYGEASYYDIATTTYSRMLLFQDGVVPAANADKLYGLIDATGKVVVPFQYAGLWSLGGGLFKVSDTGWDYGGNQGIIDATGKVIRAQSECNIHVRNGIINISSGNWNTGYTNEYYTLSMTPSTEEAYWGESSSVPALEEYDYYWESNGYYMVTQYGDDTFSSSQTGLLDKNYNVVFPLGQYTSIDIIPSDTGTVFAVSAADGSAALLDAAGNAVVPAGVYTKIYRSYRDPSIIKVSNGGQLGAIDPAGKVLVPLGDYDEVDNANQQGYIAAVSYDGSPYGGGMSNIVSKLFKDGVEVKTYTGKRVTTEVYYRDLAFTTTGELHGMMDVNENIILPEQYAAINGAYRDGAYTGDLITCTTAADSWSYIYGLYSADGRQIFADKYTELTYLADGKYRLNDGTHYGVMSTGGAAVIPFQYLDMRVHTTSFIEVYDGANYSIVDLNYNVVVPASAEPIELFKDGEYDSLGDGINRVRWYGEEYDGYTDTVMPFCIKTADGYATVYADYATGQAEGEVPYRASNINEDGGFVYQAASGLYGLASLGGGTAPVAPVTPTAPMAYTNTQPVSIDGKAVELQAYALKDANGNQTNYVKLRDVAFVLSGSAAQFNVGWDGSVNIITGSPYTANGTEMTTPFSGDRAYTIPTAATNIDGAPAALEAINLTDDSGGGYTYYKLRDLGKALGFNVGWRADVGIFIETDKPYSELD